MACECGYIGKTYLVNIEVCQECEPDRTNALDELEKENPVISLRIDDAGSIWIGFPRTKTSHLQPSSYNPVMPVSSLAYVLSDRFNKDITDTVFELREKI